MSLEADVRRGDLAKAVLENEVYAEAYGLIEQELIARWRESKDKDEREHLHRMLRSLATVQSVLQGVMNSGKVAAKDLQLERTRAQRIGDYFKSF